MKVVLLQDINSLGKKNDIKEVAEGYARNFLLPKKIAAVATEELIKKISEAKEKEEAKQKSELEMLKSLALKLNNKKITIKRKTKKDKLFGSVSVKNVQEELEKESLAVPEKSIIINEAIKKIGLYSIKINLAEKINAVIQLEVLGE
jgi:large subunit ribosomal protein L9